MLLQHAESLQAIQSIAAETFVFGSAQQLGCQLQTEAPVDSRDARERLAHHQRGFFGGVIAGV